MRSTIRALAALAMVALIGAGCGANASSDAGTGADSHATTRAKAVRFSECMRAHGVRDFPDPDASGELTIDGVVNGSSLDPDSPAWKEAIGACKDLQPSGFTGHERTAEEQKNALAFAQCVRDNGVEGFPDPTEDAPLVDTRRIPSAAGDGGMAMLNAAMQKCRDAAAKAGVSGP